MDSNPAKVGGANGNQKPPLESLISTHDFADVASKTLTPKTWAFYSSAATDLNTKSRNNSAYTDIGLRPRVLTDVKIVNTTTSMLGYRMDVPIFCSPAAMAKLVHPDGEKGLARGCKKSGIPQCISTNTSYPLSEVFESISGLDNYGTSDGEFPIFFQLYVNKEREKTEALLKEVELLGVKAIFLTVDAPIPGKREADERIASEIVKYHIEVVPHFISLPQDIRMKLRNHSESLSTPMSGAKAKNDSKGGALGRIMGAYIDSSLSWDDLPWLRKSTSLPIVLKGIQTAMDAKKAMDLGIDAIVLSNHGGRSLDTAPPPILVLLELQKHCPEVFDSMEVFVDGGIMRGTDIFKALCLGAKSVGIGRGFLYALNYGQEGVEKYIEILRDELETTMRMMGITHLSQVHPGLLNTNAVDHLIPDASGEHPYAKWRPKSRI